MSRKMTIGIVGGVNFYPSMWQDLHAGKRTEIDALNGAVCELAQKHHIPTPYNTMLTLLVKAAEVKLQSKG